MKIAVTTDGDQIFQHFGQCPAFTVFTVENGEVREKTLMDAAGNGHGALALFLKKADVDVVICGGIGGGARQMLSEAGIQLISGMEGSIEDAVAAYIRGGLEDKGGSCSHHGHHGSGHSCEHQCHS